MDQRGSAAQDWTKRYRLVAGVYARRACHILMLDGYPPSVFGYRLSKSNG